MIGDISHIEKMANYKGHFPKMTFQEAEEECHALCKKGLYLPAYECAMRVSHYFNMLEARGAISVSDRTNIITKIRNLAKACAKVYVDSVEPKEDKKEEATK